MDRDAKRHFLIQVQPIRAAGSCGHRNGAMPWVPEGPDLEMRGLTCELEFTKQAGDAFNNSTPFLGGSTRGGQAGSPGVPMSWGLCRKGAAALRKARSERGVAGGARSAFI